MPRPEPVILAIDIGSSSVRAALYDEHAEVIHGSAEKLEREFVSTPDGASELDPERSCEEVQLVIDRVLSHDRLADLRITHVVQCSFWHSLVGVDGNGRPTTPVLGWADTRSRDYSAIFKQRLDECAVHDRTGAHFHSSFWPAKLLWLRNEHADTFARTAKWTSFADYLSAQLLGTDMTSISMASATGILDQAAVEWDSELLDLLALNRENLPSIGDQKGKLKASFADRWPALKDAEWLAALGDGAADHVGCAGLDQSTASLMIGTSAAMRVGYRGEPPHQVPNGLWSYRIDRERVIVGGALSDGGNLYRKMRDEFSIPADAEERIADRGPGANGLTLLPFFFGERSTGYNEGAQGALIGRTPDHDGADILQSAMEAVAFRLAEINDRLNAASDIKKVVLSGGALRESAVWAQIVADVLGRDLYVGRAQESASRGAVLLALESLGKIDGIEVSNSTDDRVIRFDADRHDAYRKVRKRHEAAYRKFGKTS